MGKAKGKQRKDKFYKLAKETGYRARSAFKLIQLNRKYEFLQSSRVLIDLCAAPGGWLQVAARTMPVSSVLIGVDLFPIKPIPNCITLVQDITTDACRSALVKHLGQHKADCVIHDGAPNVGANWLHDAFAQAELTLSAVRLACDFLNKGGWFISKVFRSKDYNSLLWVLQQLFNRVMSTKPQASRQQSAEIYVVCKGFLAPDKIDKKFFDPKHVFKVLAQENESAATKSSLLNVSKQPKPKPEGYPEGDVTLHHKLNASELLVAENYIELLQNSHEIILDTDNIRDSCLMTDEIRLCCQDVKVLGRRELKLLLNWRKKMAASLEPGETIVNEEEKVDSEEDEDAQVAKDIEECKKLMLKKNKKTRQKLMKMKKTLRERMILNRGSDGPDLESQPFSLQMLVNRAKYSADNGAQSNEKELDDELSDSEASGVDVAHIPERTDRPSLAGMDSDADEELEMQHMESRSKRKQRPQKIDPAKSNVVSGGDELDVDSEDSNDGVPESTSKDGVPESTSKDGVAQKGTGSIPAKELPENDQEIEIVPVRELDAETLALGSMIASSSIAKRDINDWCYNRYAKIPDENLPSWFVDDEQKHYRKQVPVTKELMADYKRRLAEFNCRPIKKVAQAKAKKRYKAMKKMEQLKKKAEALTEDSQADEREKMSQLRSLYKKAKTSMKRSTKKERKYVVASKAGAKRPTGMKKGDKYKVVDKRLKKDKRSKLAREKRSKGGKGRR